MMNNPLCQFLASSIGKKIIVALTGATLVLFLAAHLTGNLLLYVGADDFNEYAAFLHKIGHGFGIWIARIGLLATITAHVLATIALVIENKKAKVKTYECDRYVQANKGSRWMIWSGLTILSFVVFHILHFTVRVDAELDALASAGNPYEMVILGFQNILVVIFYIFAMTCLCSHLSHGVASIFQTLGLRTKKNAKLIDYSARAYTLVIYVGFISLPLAVYFGIIK